jgi:hypothetical protein
MTPETATIGRLVDTKTLFLEYRKKLQDVYTDVAIISNASLYFSSVYCDCNNLNLSEMAILTSSTS